MNTIKHAWRSARRWFKVERNRWWLYGVIEAALYAASGYGLVSEGLVALLLTVPAAALGLARRNVRNPAD